MRHISLIALSLLSARAWAQGESPRASMLRARTDSLAVFFIEGTDTTHTGFIRDELAFVDLNGRKVLRRVYTTQDQVLGARLDTLVDDAGTLGPVSHHSRSSSSLEFLEFSNGRVTGWMRLANGDSVSVAAAVAAGVVNGSSFDLVLRASPLRDGWQREIPAFLSGARAVVVLRARVVGTDTVDGEPAWRVGADFAGTPVTFWIGKDSRRLRRQVMQLRPNRAILFASPAAAKPAKRAA